MGKQLRRLVVLLICGVFFFGLNASTFAGDDTVYLEQGWDDTQRKAYYETPQGSNLVPKDFYFALEQANKRKLFSSPKNIRKFKYLFDDNGSGGDGDVKSLPIGFAVEPQAAGDDWIGYTCSACHTNEIRYMGHRIRIDGAPSLADFNGFVAALSTAVTATLSKENKFKRFARRINGDDISLFEPLRQRLENYSDYISGFVTRNGIDDNRNYGRVDAFGIIMNELFVDDLHYPDNLVTPTAPVSYPFLWNTPSHDFVQWNGSGSNPIGRNVGEVLGTFGSVELVDPATFGETSARGKELIELENLIISLKSPIWPEAVLGELDVEKVDVGRVIYQEYRGDEPSCESCHALKNANGVYPLTPAEENAFGAQFVVTHMTPLAEIGTDPGMALNFVLRTVSTAHLAPLLPAPYTGAAELPAPLFLSILAGIGTRSSIEAIEPPLSQAALFAAIGYRVAADGFPAYAPKNLVAYRARPLDGIWATAPYLHNGSVQNLHQLLLPAEHRKASFNVGSRKFDAKRVGFKEGRGKKTSALDTSEPGNSNMGHEYGTSLSDDERWQLIEFLKSL